MYLPKFHYFMPQTVPDALKCLADSGHNSKVIAGGTDLMVALKQRRSNPDFLIDLSSVKELSKIELCDDGRLKIGAMATLAQVAESPLVQSFSSLLAQAAWEVGSPLLRNRGTVGGNIFQETRCRYYNQSANWRKGKATCLKMGGRVCHINPQGKKCLSTYAGDLAPSLLAEEASVEIKFGSQTEEVTVSRLFTGEGSQPFNLQPGALASAVYLPPQVKGETRTGTYWKLRTRPSIDFPIVGVAVSLSHQEPGGVKVKIGLTGIFSKPQIAVRTGEFLSGTDMTEKDLTQAAKMIVEESKVIDTSFFPVSYRKQMLAQGLLEAGHRLTGKGGISQ